MSLLEPVTRGVAARDVAMISTSVHAHVRKSVDAVRDGKHLEADLEVLIVEREVVKLKSVVEDRRELLGQRAESSLSPVGLLGPFARGRMGGKT